MEVPLGCTGDPIYILCWMRMGVWVQEGRRNGSLCCGVSKLQEVQAKAGSQWGCTHQGR